jgi:hypothetical protein
METMNHLRKRLKADPEPQDYPAQIMEIDRAIRERFRCPIGHMDAQNFYDSLFNNKICEGLEKIQKGGSFVDLGNGPEFDEYYRMIGLACADPWRGKENPDAPGFRQELRNNPKATASKYGFYINDRIAQCISDGLTDLVVKIMELISEEWCDVTITNITERNLYPRIADCFPPGWVKRP